MYVIVTSEGEERRRKKRFKVHWYHQITHTINIATLTFWIKRTTCLSCYQRVCVSCHFISCFHLVISEYPPLKTSQDKSIFVFHSIVTHYYSLYYIQLAIFCFLQLDSFVSLRNTSYKIENNKKQLVSLVYFITCTDVS